jgi:general secretion pathway protein E
LPIELANRNLLRLSHHASAERSLRKLWEATEFTANGFADEVATFYGLQRLTLPQLVTTPSLAGRFSPRFLRDTAVFPFEFAQSHCRLAVADPSDTAAVHAAPHGLIVVTGPMGSGKTTTLATMLSLLNEPSNMKFRG